MAIVSRIISLIIFVFVAAYVIPPAVDALTVALPRNLVPFAYAIPIFALVAVVLLMVGSMVQKEFGGPDESEPTEPTLDKWLPLTEDSPTNEWACDHCNALNPPSIYDCHRCGAPKTRPTKTTRTDDDIMDPTPY